MVLDAHMRSPCNETLISYLWCQQGGEAISGSSGDSEGQPGKGCGNKGKATKKRVHDDADDVPDIGELG